MKANNDTETGINEKARRRGRPAIVWTPEQRVTIEEWDSSIPKLAKALGCSVGKAWLTLKQCVPVDGA